MKDQDKTEEQDKTEDQAAEPEPAADRGETDDVVEAQDETPQDDAAQDETSQDEAPQDEVVQDEAPQDEVVQDRAPHDEVVQDEAPHDDAPHENVVRDEAPHDDAARYRVVQDDEAARDDAAVERTAQDEEDFDWTDDDPPYESSRPGALVATFVAGLASGLVLFLLWGVVTGGDDAADSDTRAATTSGSDRESGSGDGSDLEVLGAEASAAPGGDTPLARCTEAQDRLRASLDAAQPAMDQWSIHVGAMNKLVVGEITLQQAADFWNNTRIGARSAVDRFRDAMAPLRRNGVDCPRPDLMGTGGGELPACARRVDAHVKAVQAARTSVGTWDKHIHHMDMLRTGTMSPEEATQLWLTMWQRGARELDAYRIAERTARRNAGCGTRGTSG